MFKRTHNNEDIDINQNVSELADSLDDLLRSYGSKTESEVSAARTRAEKLLKQTRSRLQGNNRVTQAAKEASDNVDHYVRDKPWHGVGIGTAVGVVVGALLAAGATSGNRN